MLREPLLFDAMSVHNPITDLTSHIFEKSHLNSTLRTQFIEEYGNIEDKEIYDILRLMSPYHIPFYKDHRYSTDLYLSYDHDKPD